MGNNEKASTLIGKVASLSCTTWNVRALFCVDASFAKKKLKFVSNHLLATDVMGIQETHGNSANVKKMQSTHEKTHAIYYTQHPNPKAGGNIIGIKKDLLGPDTVINHEEIVAGRAHLVEATAKKCTISTIST